MNLQQAFSEPGNKGRGVGGRGVTGMERMPVPTKRVYTAGKYEL